MPETIIQAICKATGWSLDAGQVEVPLPGGRTQGVRFERFSEDGEDFVRLFSVIGPAAKLDLNRMTAALRLNANLRFGAFAIVGPQFAVVDTFLVREAEPDELQQSMAFVAKTADRYEQVVFGTDAN